MSSPFRATVYSFYRSHKRPFPWRSTADPYQILVSELMLQQTQVERVVTKYEQFVRVFPTVRSLVRASLRDVLLVWQGLGYNRRARYLQQACRMIVLKHAGRVPSDYAALRALPGIGAATASSILAFAFDIPTVFIETNIRAVFIHHFFKQGSAVRDVDILPLIDETLDKQDPRQWYYALMDYGAWLKKEYRNPSRRSAHHSRQSRFEGSDRQLRSQILRKILTVGSMREALLCRALPEKPERLKKIIESLCADGLIRKESGVLRV